MKTFYQLPKKSNQYKGKQKFKNRIKYGVIPKSSLHEKDLRTLYFFMKNLFKNKCVKQEDLLNHYDCSCSHNGDKNCNCCLDKTLKFFVCLLNKCADTSELWYNFRKRTTHRFKHGIKNLYRVNDKRYSDFDVLLLLREYKFYGGLHFFAPIHTETYYYDIYATESFALINSIKGDFIKKVRGNIWI